MPSAPRAALAVCALALAGIPLAGCAAAGEALGGSAMSAPAGEQREQLIERIKEEAGPAEIAYLREHREEIEAQAEGEAEYGEAADGGTVDGEAEEQREFDENGEVETG